MSLDVYLVAPGTATGERRERIFVRRDGAQVELTREEWDAEYPGREPHVVVDDGDGDYVYEANITHNLGKMASEVTLQEDGYGYDDLYDVLWRPGDHGLTHARDLIEPLRLGVAILNSDFDRLEEFNPENGWGDYALLVRFTANYLVACERWPDAEVVASR